jgi:hypothetical protein
MFSGELLCFLLVLLDFGLQSSYFFIINIWIQERYYLTVVFALLGKVRFSVVLCL